MEASASPNPDHAPTTDTTFYLLINPPRGQFKVHFDSERVQEKFIYPSQNSVITLKSGLLP